MKRRKIFTFLFLFLFFANFAYPSEKDRILRIEIIGNERVDKGVILNAIKSKENDIYDPERLREDLKSIYKTGFFSDVQIDLKETERGKIVTFVVIERPVVKAIYILGNKRVKTDDIKDKIKIKTNTVLNTERLKESVEEIKKLYSSKAYYATKVDAEIDYGESYEVTINFKIEEGKKAYVKKIDFIGNKSAKSSELKKFMKVKEKGVFSWFTGSGILDEDVLEEDRKNIEAFYMDRGHVNVRTSPPEIKVSPDGKSITISMQIDEGPVFKVGKIDFSGDLIVPPDELKKILTLKTGDLFKSSTFHKDVIKITDLYQDKGYAFCDVTPLTSIDEEQKRVDITFDIKKNEEVYFNRINIIGNVKTKDKVIRRELKFAEGDRFSATKLSESKRRLRNTLYFQDVDLKIQRTERPNFVNVDVTLEERPTGTLSLGVGYSTAEKVLLTGSVSQENLFGTGRKVYLEAQLGSTSSDFRLTAIDPYFLDYKLSTGISLSNYRREMDVYDYKTTGGSLFLRRPFTDYVSAGLKYRYDRNEVYNVDPTATKYIKEQKGKRTTSSFTFSLGKNTVDDILNPTKGDFGDVSIEVAGGALGGNVEFVKSIAYYGRYIKAGFWDSTFMLKAQVGSIWPYGRKKLPIYEKFFVGGINTIRGFRYGEAGPKDEEGEVIGGTKKIVFNAEWIFPIFKPAGIKGVVFFDCGHAFDKTKGFFQDYRFGSGFGIRWLSPLGPMRLELGYNLSPRKGERRSVFDFMIGTFY
ncbi:MAG: outer membrane protein assembly factor BamA [Deltaproteobacteria bacterium]|nr:outer membrane protein assembly factor BamA [Deltaproteobacteria bacterium]